MKKIDLKQFWSDLTERYAKDPSKFEPNPKRDWTILFVVFTLMLIGSGVIHYLLYRHFVAESNREIEVTPDNVKTLSVSEVQKTISAYKVRAAVFDQIYKSKKTYSDPSI